jgi:hypothetical protein
MVEFACTLQGSNELLQRCSSSFNDFLHNLYFSPVFLFELVSITKQMSSKTSATYNERVPTLKEGRADIDQWERKFNDYAIGAKWKALFNGSEIRPEEMSPQELQQVPAA